MSSYTTEGMKKHNNMKRIIALMALCLTLQTVVAQSRSVSRSKAKTTRKTTTRKTVAALNKYDVSRFFGIVLYDYNDVIRQLRGYEWVVTSKSEVQREFFPNEFSYRSYPSHPEYRLVGHSLFSSQGQLRVVLMLHSSDFNKVLYEDKEIGLADVMTKCLMIRAYKNNAYNANLAPDGVRKEIEEQLMSGENCISSNADVQKATRYCEQLREDCCKETAKVRHITRVDARTFKVQFANENNNPTYSATVKFRSDEPYKVAYDITLPDGFAAYLYGKEALSNASSIGFVPQNNTEIIANDVEYDDKVYEVVEEQPKFPGGNGALNSWLRDNMRYPVVASENGISGKVIVQFIVGADGAIRNAKVFRGIDPLLDHEALRLVGSMPKWNPGRQNGKAVNVRYTLPIVFRLQ